MFGHQGEYDPRVDDESHHSTTTGSSEHIPGYIPSTIPSSSTDPSGSNPSDASADDSDAAHGQSIVRVISDAQAVGHPVARSGPRRSMKFKSTDSTSASVNVKSTVSNHDLHGGGGLGR